MQHLRRLGLVVDRIENRYDVVCFGRVELGDVRLPEGRVGQPAGPGFGGSDGQPLFGEVDTGEPAVPEMPVPSR